MTSQPAEPAPQNPVANWDAVFAAVNAWRGECMHHFSAVEQAITETLLVLDAAKPEGSGIRLRHLIGQQFEDLAAAIGPEGPFADLGKSAGLVLGQYRERHETFRSKLCHGHVTVSVECNGHWLLVVRTLAIRARQADRTLDVIQQAEAEGKLAELKRDGQKLAAVLGQVRKAATGGH